MEEVLNFLIETVKPLVVDSSKAEPEKTKLADGYAILLEENRDVTDRVIQSSKLFISDNRYLETLINKIETIIQPLSEDITIENADLESFKLILAGKNILLDENIELQSRIQLACDKFDEAQYKPYNPYHSRVALARAIATYEYSYGGKEFRRTKKEKIEN
ncbi:MAG: hypothetical protein HeimC2_31480 [Candidatus Heimdallarchaeota archaeon LC_2]|nr:MAG: hypothetical protein HeimC2_31480 [Candidatus Heimdallarchaeota archaeon LC_2]